MNTISLCMIVRDGEEAFLRNCLRNAREGVEECILVVDLETPALRSVADEFQCTLVAHPFQDFASQRNVSLREATQDWILVLDADEVLAPEGLQRLRALAQGEGKAFLLDQLNYTKDTRQTRFVPANNMVSRQYGFPGFFPVPCVRFFRRLPGIEFTRRVHELVEESLERQGIRPIPSGLEIHHLKALKGEAAIQQDELRYLALLEQELQDRPTAKAWFDKGTILLFTRQDPAAAAAAFEQALLREPGFQPARMNLAYAYAREGAWDKALAQYLRLPPSFPVLLGRGTCLFRLGKRAAAAQAFQEAGRREPPRAQEAAQAFQALQASL